MDCNKEEALRAKVLAENKMRNGDFVGAKKIAQKAQQLFPEIENIFQLLSVCDVHCSAQVKINGNETDWYGILQVERTADESVIRKQYRKLALLLHPDKNKFSGAEAAFKLIGEANMVLSDRDKRHMFDMKTKMVVRSTTSKAPHHHSNRNTHTRKNNVVQGVTSSHFTARVNIQPQMPSNQKQTFWTCCPFCNVRYQYYKDFINRALRCQSCIRPFIAYDLGDQGVPVTWNHSAAVNQQKTIPNPGNCGSRVQNSSSNLSSSSEFPGNVGGNVGGKAPFSGKGGGTDNVEGDGLHKGRDSETADMSEKVHLPRDDKAIPQHPRAPKKNKPKKGRKQVVESSESSLHNKSSESDDNTDHDSGIDSGKHPRRSSRQRRKISYSENLSDDDFSSQPKKSKHKDSSIGDENVKVDTIQTNIPTTEGGFSHTVAESMENLAENRDEDGRAETVHHDDGGSNVSEVGVNVEANGNFFNVPDSEFNDFDKAREDDCFAVGQIWAVYDTIDGMPRFYARVKVLLPGFKLRITWLEPRLAEKDEIKWYDEELPICCGKFGHGNTVVNSEKAMFSHLVNFNTGNTRNTYMIYPKKGETWALFKDWNICWSSDPENHKKNGFEVVRIISDYEENCGVKVAYLEKVEGFVSLFRRVTEGLILFVIPPTEKLRFSHQIPFVVTDGTEKEGVEAGYFELDPAALPSEWFGPHHSDNARADDTDTGVGSRMDNKENYEDGSNPLSANTNMEKNISDPQEKQNSGFEESMKARHPVRFRTGGSLDKQPTSQMEGFEKFTDNCEVESDMRTGNNTGTVKYPTNVKRSRDSKIPMKGHGVNGSSEKNNADASVKEGMQYRDSRLKQAYSNTEECDEVYVVNDGER